MTMRTRTRWWSRAVSVLSAATEVASVVARRRLQRYAAVMIVAMPTTTSRTCSPPRGGRSGPSMSRGPRSTFPGFAKVESACLYRGGASSLLSAVVRLLLLVPGLEAFFFCKLPLLLLLCASRRRRPRRANPGCGVHPPCSLHTHLPRVQLGQHVGRQEQRGWLTVQEAERSNTHAAVASPLAPSLGWTPPVHASLQPATAPLSPVPPLLHAFAVALQRLGRDGASSSSRSSSSSSSSSAGRRETE